jgi:hypothetical protein
VVKSLRSGREALDIRCQGRWAGIWRLFGGGLALGSQKSAAVGACYTESQLSERSLVLRLSNMPGRSAGPRPNTIT